MQIDVNGKQIDIGDALRGHVVGELTASMEKYAERPTEAAVTFTRDGHEFKCECSAHLSTGMKAQASGRAGDIYAAFDMANDRLAKQLRRYKRRLKNHHKARNTPFESFGASSFVIEADAPDVEDASESLQPVIIAEAKTSIPVLSVGEAVLQMEIGEEPLLMFRNEKNNEIGVVYRRDDGNVGWIEPSSTPPTASA
jgi:ribosomal subunit interface protein